MNFEALILFSLGFIFLLSRRTLTGFLCGLQICAMSLIAFSAASTGESLSVSFVVLISSGIIGAVGISVVSRSGIQEGRENE